MSLQAALLRDFDQEIPYTTKLLAAVPDDKLDWKPHEKSMSLGQLAGHLAECPMWVGSMMEDEMDFANMGDYQPYVPTTSAEAIATFEKNNAALYDALKGREDAFLETEWTMRKGDQVLMKQPRHEVIRSVLLHHQAHHRGQLTVYLRLLDVPVPATYGGTADEEMF